MDLRNEEIKKRLKKLINIVIQKNQKLFLFGLKVFLVDIVLRNIEF